MQSRIAYTKPSITALEVSLATDAAQNGWGEQCYEYIGKFEAAFKGYVGTQFAIATSSCTGALHMGLSALGIGPGDEVILADTNWIASCAPIVHLGAHPVFVDILPKTWCLDPLHVEKAITPKTKAILAVHLYGNLCEMDSLLRLGQQYNIPVIEDSAEALGSKWQGRHAGSMGKFGTFSFHGTKTLTTGEGGMFVTNDASLYEKVLTLSNHGRDKQQKKQFWADVVGFKYKMSNIQAALGYGQMQRINELVGRKREILNYYKKALVDIPFLEMNPEPLENEHGAWMPTVVFAPESGVSREMLMTAFQKDNIDARVFFHPLSSLPMFVDCPENIHSWNIPERAINLPSFHDISQAEQDRVIAVIRQVANEQR